MSPLAPGGWLTLSLLSLVFAASAYGIARLRHWPLQLICAALAFLMAAMTGVSYVNRYYSYYTTWSALAADLRADNGATAAPVRITVAPNLRTVGPPSGYPTSPPMIGRWTVHQIALPGASSGIRGRSGLVVLPPAFSPTSRLPVLVLLHGEPGTPTSWTNGLQLASVLQDQAAAGLIAPMAVVLPDVTGSFADQQCLDASDGTKLSTYLGVDVPADIQAALPVTPDTSGWVIGGLSAGGYCAAELGLHYPTTYHWIAVLDGYFQPDLPNIVIRRVYAGHRAEAQKDDVQFAAHSQVPLPHFWVMAGTGNAPGYEAAVQFATAVGQQQDLRFVTVDGGKHNPRAWRAALPELLRWASASLGGRTIGGSIEIPLSGNHHACPHCN